MPRILQPVQAADNNAEKYSAENEERKRGVNKGQHREEIYNGERHEGSRARKLGGQAYMLTGQESKLTSQGNIFKQSQQTEPVVSNEKTRLSPTISATVLPQRMSELVMMAPYNVIEQHSPNQAKRTAQDKMYGQHNSSISK